MTTPAERFSEKRVFDGIRRPVASATQSMRACIDGGYFEHMLEIFKINLRKHVNENLTSLIDIYCNYKRFCVTFELNTVALRS